MIQGRFRVVAISPKPLEPREGEPGQPNKAYKGLLGLVGKTWLPFPKL